RHLALTMAALAACATTAALACPAHQHAGPPLPHPMTSPTRQNTFTTARLCVAHQAEPIRRTSSEPRHKRDKRDKRDTQARRKRDKACSKRTLRWAWSGPPGDAWHLADFAVEELNVP